MSEFKFQIGQLVYTSANLQEIRDVLRAGKLGSPRCGMVEEQISHTCCGGTQLYYAISLGGGRFKEPEANLVAVGDPIVDALFDQIMARQIELRKEEARGE